MKAEEEEERLYGVIARFSRGEELTHDEVMSEEEFNSDKTIEEAIIEIKKALGF